MPGPEAATGRACRRGLGACCAALALAGCIAVPVSTREDKVLAGKPVAREQLAFLAPKVTTKREVIDRLGSPNVIWEDARVFAYNWEMRQGILFWAISGYTTGAAGAEDIPKHYVLLILFDDHDRVERFERAVRPGSMSYGKFIERWLKRSPDE
jgi:outer membrane protein assembly factor BamE (lipoprotein component of BamABCDE complex)